MAWHLSLPLMNNFKAAIFLMQAVLPGGFLFSQLKKNSIKLIKQTNINVSGVCVPR